MSDFIAPHLVDQYAASIRDSGATREEAAVICGGIAGILEGCATGIVAMAPDGAVLSIAQVADLLTTMSKAYAELAESIAGGARS